MTPTGLIDLHLHTTASDGVCEPPALVEMAWRAGIRTMSVTDHDTVAGLDAVDAAAKASHMEFVPGIEITAVHDGRDVHVLGYFIDRASVSLAQFLEQQRVERLRRVNAIADRLAEMGKPITREPLRVDPASGRAIGRPTVAKALVRAGHVADMRQAFAELLGEGRPAYVPRCGPSPADVVAIIQTAGGVASLAHPAILKRDDLIPAMASSGLDALEAFHSEHDAAATARYLTMAADLGLLVSGGSDYHGEPERRRAAFGTVGLPQEHFDRLRSRVKAN